MLETAADRWGINFLLWEPLASDAARVTYSEVRGMSAGELCECLAACEAIGKYREQIHKAEMERAKGGR